MFGFNKKKKENKPAKKQSGLDKILMGMVVGGAIGSVIGVGLAPKKGSETRKEVSKKAGKLFGGLRGIFRRSPKDDKSVVSARHQVDIQKNSSKSNAKVIPEEK